MNVSDIKIIIEKMIQSVMNLKMVKSRKKWKNCVKFLVCVLAMFGLAACGGSSGTGGSDTPTVPPDDTPIIALETNFTIRDGDIESSGDNYIFTLDFTADILAESVSKDDFTADLGNITILGVDATPSTGAVNEITVEFNFTDPNNTAKEEITIVVGSIIGSEEQTNAEDIVFYIDRAPRVLSIDGNSKTAFNKSELSNNGNEISYTFIFSEAIADLDKDDFVIVLDSSGISVQPTNFSDGIKDATVTFTFTVLENTDAAFSITLPNDSYTDVESSDNKEIIADLPINIVIDNIAPAVIPPLVNLVLSDSASFNLTIEFDEPLNFNSFQGTVLTTTNILTTNLTIGDPTIDNNGKDGKGRVVIEATIIGDNPTITINSDSYSDTLGNTGENDYTLNVIIDDELLFINNICQNFPFDDGNGLDSPYQVSHICQLQNIDADDITIGDIAYTDLLNKNYILKKNIEANYTAEWNNGAGFVPLGDISNIFNGTFDGGGFTISNLTISSDSNNIGLFGVNSGTIINVTLDNASVIGNENVGALVGFDDNGTYSGNSYCQQDSELPAVGNGST